MRVLLQRWLIAVLTTLCLQPVLNAQSYTFQDYMEGLGNPNVACILRDHAGYLWLGSQNGVFRYDGARFQEFSRADGLRGTFVLSLHEDGGGRLWAGTSEG